MARKYPRDPLIKSYDKYALERDSSKLPGWKVDVRSKFLAALHQVNAHSLLEIGSGPGRDGLFFQENGLNVTCIDISPVMVELCRVKGLHAKVMDARELKFPAASFDAIYCMNSLLHLRRAELPEVLCRMDRILKPEGLVFIGVYGGVDQEGIWEDDFYSPKRFFSFFTDEAIQRVVGEIFELVSFERIMPEPDTARPFQCLMVKKKDKT